MKNDYINYSRIRQTYSGRKWKATDYVLITLSPYRCAETSSQLRSCLNDSIINAAPRIGGRGVDQSELYRQCSLRRVKDTERE